MIADNLKRLREEVRAACARAGRDVSEIRVVLVTKNVSIPLIQAAYEAGMREFGENKVQEFLTKVDKLPADIQWHFVGQLQSNKVKYIVDKVKIIHSVDRLSLAKEIEKQAAKQQATIEVLIQVNTSHEDTKSGIDESNLEQLVTHIKQLQHIKIKGLMTIGPFTRNADWIRQCFSTLRQLRDRMSRMFPDIDWQHLSMGMSGDYQIAIEEGATMIRIGTAVFGERS